MKFVFFKTPQNKRFKYSPIYYDEQKDALEQRLKGSAISDSREYKEVLRSKIQHSWKSNQTQSAKKYAIIRPVIILIIATILIFIFLERLTDFISVL